MIRRKDFDSVAWWNKPVPRETRCVPLIDSVIMAAEDCDPIIGIHHASEILKMPSKSKPAKTSD